MEEGGQRSRGGVARSLLVSVLVGPAAGAAGAATAAALGWSPGWWIAAGLGAGGAAAAIGLYAALGRVRQILSALEDGVRSFREADYSLRIASSGATSWARWSTSTTTWRRARAERRDRVQRELLLDTLLHGVPVATVLVAGTRGRVVFSNRAARQLLGEGRRLEGQRFAEILARAPAELEAALSGDSEALFTVRLGGADETFKAGRRGFELHGHEHTLFLLERLTPELRRREVEAWKNAVRIVNHDRCRSPARTRAGSTIPRRQRR